MTGLTPNAEQWSYLQGGQPIILRSPEGSIYELVHAYPDNYGTYSGPMAIVPTPSKQLRETRNLNLLINGQSSDGVVVPAALLWDKHGQPCQDRSDEQYEALAANEVELYLENRIASGWSRFVLEPEVTRPRLIRYE